jgi:hypothetical protein
LVSHGFNIYRVLIGYKGEENDDRNWIEENNLTNYSPTVLYNAAFYFISVTVMTVGYGDISGNNFGERSFCIPLVLLGAAAFAYGVGSINSIVGNYDSQQTILR